MKIAISGKGGVGKTSLAALLARAFASDGYSVLAVDADPNANLASAIGFPHPEEIVPISEMKDLIEERTGAKPGQTGTLFTLNPKVEDIPERFAKRFDGIKLLIMGKIKQGGSGCYCPENALLKTLTTHLLLSEKEVVIMDMEAGIEHLGRATAQAVDKLIVVVEPGRRSIQTALAINKLAKDIGLKQIALVGNKMRGQADIEVLKSSLPDFEFLGFIPFDQTLIDADLSNKPVTEASQKIKDEVKRIYSALQETASSAVKKHL